MAAEGSPRAQSLTASGPHERRGLPRPSGVPTEGDRDHAHDGTPKTPADLLKHNCVGYRRAGSDAVYAWAFTKPDRGAQGFAVEPKGHFVANDDEAMLRAALEGYGLVQHIDVAVRSRIDEGRLVRVLRASCPPFPGFYLYVPSREMPSKVQALRDLLVEKNLGRSRRAR